MLVAVGLSLLFAAGCEQPIIGKYRFLQPDKPIAKPDQAQVNWIIQNMGELDKSDEIYPNATKPGPQDWVYVDEDYIIAPMDDLSISIMDLYAEGMETTLPRKVSDSGYIDLPNIEKRVMAAGLTGQQLTEEIKRVYSENVLRNPQVSVAVVVRRQQTFSMLGAVNRPGAYPFPRTDLRMLDAIAMAGGIYQPDIETIYVIRQAPAPRKSQVGPLPPASQPTTNPQASKSRVVPDPSRRFMLAASSRQSDENHGQLLLAETESTPKAALEIPAVPTSAPATQAAVIPAAPTSAPATQATVTPETPTTTPATPAVAAPAEPTKAADESEYRWVYKNGEWVKVQKNGADSAPDLGPTPKPLPTLPPLSQTDTPTRRVEPIAPTVPATDQDAEDPFGWGKIEKNDLVRIIAVNLPKLRQGDYRQNIVIRPNDIIQVPMIPQGEFYIMGEVYRPGVYSLTGRQVTIKMALAAAGNLGPMAWPSNSVLIRRIGKNQEQTIPINVENIMQGKAPDLYLKKNDIIAIGTHWSTSFLAVLRNAFRMTYGFGFIYDRNFSDPMTLTPSSRRFKEW